MCCLIHLDVAPTSTIGGIFLGLYFYRVTLEHVLFTLLMMTLTPFLPAAHTEGN